MSTPLSVALVSIALGCPPGEYPRAADPERPQLVRQRLDPTRTLLRTRLSVDWDQATARDALAQIEHSLGIPFLERYGDPDDWNELDPETPITLTLENASALTVLEHVLAQCSLYERCTWQVRGRSIEVGSWSRLSVAATHKVRLYQTADLTFAVLDFANAPGIDIQAALSQTRPGGGGGSGGGSGGGGAIITEPGQGPDRSEAEPRSQNLVEAITSLIEPEVWSVHGGPATIVQRGRFLVVRAPNFVHRQIGGYPAQAAWRGSERTRTAGLAVTREPGRPY